MSYRFLDPHPQFLTDAGEIVAGGSLTFYENNTTTPKSCYGEPALSTDNGSVLTLDSAGRAQVEIWLDGEYSVKLMTSAAVQVWLKDDVRDLQAGGINLLDPSTGTDGQVLGTDGVDYVFVDVEQVPDPTGHSGEQLGTDGTLTYWEAKTTYSETSLPTGITQAGANLQVGKFKIQTSTDSAPTFAGQTTSKAVTFSEAYASTPLFVGITPTVGAVTGESGGVEVSAVSISTTGFTATFIAPDMGAVAGSENITSTVNFTWMAMGIVA